MPYPSIINFGIEANPLIDSPFVEGTNQGAPTPPMFNYFLLLNTSHFGLLNGSDLLLLNSI